ncbi:MAG TPA: hypothetical protein VGY55_05935 [Pirellulales bacterium]|nr:hypothetical protein [Pirellulales bacterium]
MLTIVFTPVFGLETQIQNFNAVLPNPPVYPIFWGSYWLQGNGPQQEQQLISAARQVLNSSFLQATAQYGTGGTATYGGYSLTTTATGEPANGFTTIQSYVIDYALAHSGQLPNGDESGGITPIFAIITPPGIRSAGGSSVVGYNTNLTDDPVDSVDYPTVWCSTSVSNGGAIDVDAFTKTFSHEIAECMTDLGQGGFEVNPGPTFPNPPANSNQICDYEAQGHVYREYTGALVQSVWSRANNAFIVTDGTTQDFILNTNPAGGYDLVLNGDQPGHTNDTFYIDTISTAGGDEVKAVINSEVAVFEPNSIRSITINTGGGTNTVYVAQTTVPATINGNANDTINLGVSGSVQGINADVYIFGTVSKINVDDSSDPTNLHPAIGSGVISSLLPNSHNILFPYGLDGANENLTLDTGSGTSAVDIFDTIAGGSVTLNTVTGTNAANVQYVAPGGPLTVNLGGGAQNVNISAGGKDLSTTLLADVTVNPGTGTSTLSIDDDNATVARHFTIKAGSVSTDIAGAGVIHFGRVTDVKLSGGAHGNVFTVQNTLNGLATDIYANSGDIVNVLGTAFGSTVNLYGASLIVNVGNNGRTASLHGLLHVGGVGCSMTVDDSNDALGQNNVTISTTSITGLSDGAISYSDSALNAMTIIGSGGGSTYHVLGVPPYQSHCTTTLTCEGTDTVLVGDNGSLVGVQSHLVINNPSKFTNLTIDASADNLLGGSYATITNSHVSGLAFGEIDFDQSGLSALTIDGVRGGDPHYPDYFILGLPSYSLFPITTTLNLFAGDTVDLGPNYSLQGDWGNGNLVCSFSGSGPAAQVLLDGNLDPAGAAYTIGGNNNLTIDNATVGLGLTINGFRDQDQAVIDLPGGTVNADLTQTSRGTIVLDGSARLAGTNVRSPLNVTAHARAGAVVAMPTGSDSSVIRAFNSVDLLGSMPQDALQVYDSNNMIAAANDPIPAPYAQFAAVAGDPMTVTAGQPFDFTIVAQNANGGALNNYVNQIQWYAYNRTTGDYLSSDYESFAAADQGQHTFHAVMLPTVGTYSLGFDDGWNASSFTITVMAPHQALIDPAGKEVATPAVASATSPEPLASDAQPAAGTSDATVDVPSVDLLATTGSAEKDPSVSVSSGGDFIEVSTVQPQTMAASASAPSMIEGVSAPSGEAIAPSAESAQTASFFSGEVVAAPLPEARATAETFAIATAAMTDGASIFLALPNRQSIAVQTFVVDAPLTSFPILPAPESVGSADVETRNAAQDTPSSITVNDPLSRPLLRSKSLLTGALDECFEQFDKHIGYHTSTKWKAQAFDSFELPLSDDFLTADPRKGHPT